MSQETTTRKDTQRLQRAIVDGLEDVKAQEIQVFNTEHLSPLFERVIVASGTSNRQTKALAASVRDAVREAGFPKPRVEGEDNGEWIIVDCGAAVAHIMQPAIRNYYRLEEIWGEKPVRLKLGAPKPAAASAPPARKVAAAPTLRRSSAARTAAAEADKEAKAAKAQDGGGRRRATSGKAVADAAPAKTRHADGAAGRTTSARSTAARPSSAKSAAVKAAPAKAVAPRKAPAGKTAAGTAPPARKTPAKKAPTRAA